MQSKPLGTGLVAACAAHLWSKGQKPCKFHQCSWRVEVAPLRGIVIGAVASMVIGFWGGGRPAQPPIIAADQAGDAVVTVLTPICVEKFMQNGDAQENMAALRKITSNWQQGQYLEKGGWATRPGATSSDTSWPGRVQRNNRSQSGIPMSSVAPRDIVRIGQNGAEGVRCRR